MASTGLEVSYRDFEARSNQLAHLLAAHGLQPLDHYAIYMENNERYLEACAAGERSGLYYTCVNSYLTAEELGYILANSRAKVLITSRAKREVALEALEHAPEVDLVLVVDGGDGTTGEVRDYATAVADHPTTPLPEERLGTPMLYSSGTTGRPKGSSVPCPVQHPGESLPLFTFLGNLWHYREDMVYLSPAPLYHSAPQAAVNLTLRHGGTVVIMERFDRSSTSGSSSGTT
jgi:long-chain acyl-CoA synthetase